MMNNTTYLGLAGASTQAVLSFLYVGELFVWGWSIFVQSSQTGAVQQHYYQYQDFHPATFTACLLTNATPRLFYPCWWWLLFLPRLYCLIIEL